MTFGARRRSGTLNTLQKSVLIAGLGAIVLLGAVVTSVFMDDTTAPMPSPAQSTAPAPKASIKQAQGPSFDVVRVSADGNAVMAGRALPGSTVEILNGETVFGIVTADTRGEWVFVPDAPLQPGELRLGLRMLKKGQPAVMSDHLVILVVPERGKDIAGRDVEGSGALALRVRRDGTGASEVLQKPDTPLAVAGTLAIDGVDYGGGVLSINGRAKAGSAIHVYVDNRFVGKAITDENGRWTLVPNIEIAPGKYTLRADQVGEMAKVVARREIPFSRASDAEMQNLKPGSFVVVQPGNSLWRLARRAYGKGVRFHVIYEANQDQIKDTNLIYPGQVFRLPAQ